jgi:uncharacterized protein YbaP (TraB family)
MDQLLLSAPDGNRASRARRTVSLQGVGRFWRAMLFHVSGTDVFVFGSLHLLPEGEQLSSTVFAALTAAQDCVFESDLDHAGEPSFARYSDGETLDQHVPPELFAATSAFCERLDISGVLPDFKPWWVGLVIGVHLIIGAGNRPEFGADRQLWEATKRAGKCPFVLESIDALRAFDASPVLEQIDRLEFVVHNPDRAAIHFERLHAAWCMGDTAALGRELQAQLELSPITFRGLIHDRNMQWLPQILGAIQRRRQAVFVVGALHLAGDNSLQRLLQNHGFDLLPA